MTKSEEEALALLGAFRAACEGLCEEWTRTGYTRSQACARDLRALLAQGVFVAAEGAAREAPKYAFVDHVNAPTGLESQLHDLRVMIGVLCKDAVELSKRQDYLERAVAELKK